LHMTHCCFATPRCMAGCMQGHRNALCVHT
jgi:hypothetical protein